MRFLQNFVFVNRKIKKRKKNKKERKKEKKNSAGKLISKKDTKNCFKVSILKWLRGTAFWVFITFNRVGITSAHSVTSVNNVFMGKYDVVLYSIHP